MGLPGIILKREFVHLFLPSVCAAACVHPFIDWNPGFELPCKWFFFECALATPSHTPPPSRTPSSSSRAPSAPYTYVREDTFSFPVRASLQLVSSVTLSTSTFVALSGRMVQRAPWAANTRPPPRARLKRNLNPDPPLRCEMTRRRANKKEARSGILVIFAAPGACVTRVPVPEISRPPSFPLCGRSYVPASRFHHAGHADDTCPSFFLSSNFLNCLGLIC